jgi:hypothetical protein
LTYILKISSKDAGFSERFKRAAKAWDVAIHLAALRCREKNPDNPACPACPVAPEDGTGVHPARPVKC